MRKTRRRKKRRRKKRSRGGARKRKEKRGGRRGELTELRSRKRRLESEFLKNEETRSRLLLIRDFNRCLFSLS